MTLSNGDTYFVALTDSTPLTLGTGDGSKETLSFSLLLSSYRRKEKEKERNKEKRIAKKRVKRRKKKVKSR